MGNSIGSIQEMKNKAVAALPIILDGGISTLARRWISRPPSPISNSLLRKTKRIQIGMIPSMVMQARTAKVNILSPKGSRTFPRLVIRLKRLAIQPSRTSVKAAVA